MGIDGAQALADVTGVLTRKDVLGIWDAVKANNALWKACSAPHHTVDRIEAEGLRSKFRCRSCGGVRDGSYVLAYMDGYAAHGGDRRDVWSEADEPE